MPENDWVRVTDKDTGHKLSIRRSSLPHGNYTELKQDAVDFAGDPLPPEFNTLESLSNNSGQQADTKKEKADG